jgi:hypothetical protein
MNFHLNYLPPKLEFELTHQSNLLLIGSCFSTNISKLLQEDGFMVDVNPFGVTYNPISIFQQLEYIKNCSEYDQKLFLKTTDGVFHYQAHSSINSDNEENLNFFINQIIKKFNQKLKRSDYLIITFGSAYYYTLNDTAVANCHKQPSKLFQKKLFELNDITQFANYIAAIKEFNPNLKIIFTVSPVLHLKDGLEENFISKSTLRLLIEMLVKKFPSFCYYFPSYELVNFDLRDYRFYKDDLAHPNDQAIDYVYDKFKTVCCSIETLKIAKEINSLSKLKQHIVLNPAGKNLHLKKIEALTRELVRKYPYLNL